TDWLPDPSGLTPHGFCLSWEPGLIWTHALADSAIGLAYFSIFSIPLTLLYFARRRPDLAPGGSSIYSRRSSCCAAPPICSAC
ncbi:MAG: hypothetical protein ACJ8AW_33135, partial [Rhodopila sp.]